MRYMGFCILLPILGGLSACGDDSSGGVPGGNSPQAVTSGEKSTIGASAANLAIVNVPTTTRLSRMLYDFDNNGIFEGTREYAYDADGRLSSERYVYVDDGITDTVFGTFSIGAESSDSNILYSYNLNGLLELVTIDTVGGGRSETVYTYNDDDLITRADIRSYDGVGAVSQRMFFTLTYVGQRLDYYSWYKAPFAPDYIYELTYGADGLILSDRGRTRALLHVNQLAYTWRPDGHIDSIQETTPPVNHYSALIDYIYDATGKLAILKVMANDPNDNYQWDMLYDSEGTAAGMNVDLNSDGAIEAVVRSELEVGLCEPVYAWMRRAEPSFKADATALYLPGAGYYKLGGCL